MLRHWPIKRQQSHSLGQLLYIVSKIDVQNQFFATDEGNVPWNPLPNPNPIPSASSTGYSPQSVIRVSIVGQKSQEVAAGSMVRFQCRGESFRNKVIFSSLSTEYLVIIFKISLFSSPSQLDGPEKVKACQKAALGLTKMDTC